MTAGARRFEHVAVLLGGLSAEREVSLGSGKACADALEEAGYRVSRIDAGQNWPNSLAPCSPRSASMLCTGAGVRTAACKACSRF